MGFLFVFNMCCFLQLCLDMEVGDEVDTYWFWNYLETALIEGDLTLGISKTQKVTLQGL